LGRRMYTPRRNTQLERNVAKSTKEGGRQNEKGKQGSYRSPPSENARIREFEWGGREITSWIKRSRCLSKPDRMGTGYKYEQETHDCRKNVEAKQSLQDNTW